MGYARRLHHVINEEKLSAYIVGCHTAFVNYEVDEEYIICTVNHKVRSNASIVLPSMRLLSRMEYEPYYI